MVKSKQVKVVLAPRKTRARNKNKNKKMKNQVTLLGSALRNLGGLGGASVGALFGAPTTGASVGTSLGAALSRWLGSGDYQVSRNSIISAASSGNVPMMHKENQTIVVRHKEFVGTITGSTDFKVLYRLELNPGNIALFPWLQGVANRFQEYRIRGMVFHYVPTSGTAVSGTNPSLGSVMMQTSYRSTDDAPLNKQELLNEYWSSEAAPSEPFCHPIECDPKENPFNVQYVRAGSLPTGENKLMYDLGVTNVAVQGQLATGNTLGDLWVTYEVELKKPVVASNVTATSRSYSARFGAPTPGALFAGTATYVSGSLPMTFSQTTNQFTFGVGCAGVWTVVIRVYSSGTFTSLDFSGSPTNVTNCLPVAIGGDTYWRSVLVGAAANMANGFWVGSFRVTDPTQIATVTLPVYNWTGTATLSDVIVVPYTP